MVSIQKWLVNCGYLHGVSTDLKLRSLICHASSVIWYPKAAPDGFQARCVSSEAHHRNDLMESYCDLAPHHPSSQVSVRSGCFTSIEWYIRPSLHIANAYTYSALNINRKSWEIIIARRSGTLIFILAFRTLDQRQSCTAQGFPKDALLPHRVEPTFRCHLRYQQTWLNNGSTWLNR